MTSAPRQPLLHDAVIALHAPTQVWSDADGDLGAAPIHGVYHGDLRHIRAVTTTFDGVAAEPVSTAVMDAGTVRFGGLLRHLDDELPDPKVRVIRDRRVRDGQHEERITITSARPVPVRTEIVVRLDPDFAPLQEVKAGTAVARRWDGDGRWARAGEAGFEVRADGGTIERDRDAVVMRWSVEVPPRGQAHVDWSLRMHDPGLVVRAAGPWRPRIPSTTDSRMRRWLERAIDDLGALRLTLPDHPQDEFFAAGAPWFLTLFGRDALWAARLALPVAPAIAASTLRVLSRLQGEQVDASTAEAPGKVLHELRSEALELPSEGVTLPPRYYGTVDATPLWVCLLADAVDAGLPDDELRALLPALRAALGWLTDHGAASGSGFIDYVDESGHGLANQGWKDSGDSIQWSDATLAQGPIALCEVQAYAYEAAVRGAGLLERLGEDGADELRTWAADLRERFHDAFWVETGEGRFPAIALDAHGRAVDTLSSNIGHLLGTGILDADEERHCADLLTGPTMSSGFGVRTLSTEADGFWPLSYHGGSVWAHDTAIAVHGMLRAGLGDAAAQVATELLDAAERFDYRVPELYSGDRASENPAPAPYPAACRPQAWSAAAAVVCAQAIDRR